MSKENSREKKIEQVFAQNPQLDEIFVTSDDFAFTNVNKAEGHASGLADKTVEKHNRPGTGEAVSEAASILNQGVKKVIVALEGVNDIEVLNGLLEEENAGQNRKTAVEAIEARIKVLVDAIEVVE